ncbi:VOC family protein [Rhizobium rhizogenes]|uniref:VOC family protein n=1 Tax=Rhizobium rhizogenes TaxID=359 RepID=UPI00080F9C1E|nr:VOC family protein [Rhizobium rhizogenes]NTI43757.1 VOC family protein [Rhizobium rhizogenes]OCJ18971.1 lactoylglutathione lyase [Agrobacterium sp. B131/95]
MSEPKMIGRFFQVGIVVPDMDAALRAMTAKIGTGRFMTLPPNLKESWYRGRMETMSYALAFGYMGDIQVELMQPISGNSTYSEYLAKFPEGGVHHLGFEVDDFDAAAAMMDERGYRAVQKGSFGDTRFNYYEHDGDTGVITEILFVDPAVKDMFARIREQNF